MGTWMCFGRATLQESSQLDLLWFLVGFVLPMSVAGVTGCQTKLQSLGNPVSGIHKAL